MFADENVMLIEGGVPPLNSHQGETGVAVTVEETRANRILHLEDYGAAGTMKPKGTDRRVGGKIFDYDIRILSQLGQSPPCRHRKLDCLTGGSAVGSQKGKMNSGGGIDVGFAALKPTADDMNGMLPDGEAHRDFVHSHSASATDCRM